MSQIQFINAVKNGAISGWHKHKILPSISIAQAVLESGWGGSDLSKAPNYNLFGIKASDDWAGEVVNMPTQEWSQSKGYYWIRANFRKYNSWDESIEDHGSFFTNTPWRKQNYARVIGEKDYKVAAKMLRECGYATDVNYPSKLIKIVDQYNLTQYDRIAFEGGITNTSTPSKNTMSPDYYLRKTVGDSLSSGSEATAKHIDVTFIGDSLLVGTEPKLKRFKWKSANYNAKGSRQWTHPDTAYNAIAQLKTMLANNQVHNYVVFVLGTNRGVTADEVKQAVDLCGPGRKILLVDTLSEVKHREAVAQAYKQASEQYSNVFYGDWSRYSRLRIDDNYYKDGANGERIHMTPIGYERHANFIMHALYQMYNFGNTSGTPKHMRSVADIEYDDGIFTSPIGETIIYNKKLNDQFSFKSKKGNVLWIEKVLQTDKDDPQEAIAEGVEYMKEHAHPAVHYTVKLNELPDTVSIGDTGIFIDHEFNPPLAIEARILNITTSETNPNANTVTIGNVKELFPQTKEDISALQQQLQETREELLTQAYLDDVYVVKIESSNGLALAGGAEGFGKDLVEKVEGNTFYLIKPKSLSNGFKIKGKIDDKHLINRHDGLVADSLTKPIDFNPDYENPQGADTAYPLKPFDSHELEVFEFTATFYDEAGELINIYKIPIYLDGNFNLPLKFDRIPHTMKVTSDNDITFDYILVFEEYLSVEEDETTELTARVFKNGVEITDEIDHFNWTKVSSDGREDEGWKDLNKFNQTNKITVKASDLKDFESRFNVKAFDKRIEELIASNGVTIKNQISPALAEAKAEAERMDAEIKKEIDTVLDRFDTERTETEQAINEALESAKAEAERLDNERQLIIDGKFEVVNKANEKLEQSIATAEQNAQNALDKAGGSEDLAKTAKQASENALTQFQATSKELSEAKSTAEQTLKNALNALSNANSVVTQSQTLLDNAKSAKTEATNALIEAQKQLEASGVISGNLTTFKNEVNNAIKGFVTQATYDSNNKTLNTRMNEWEKTANGIKTSISEVSGKVDNLSSDYATYKNETEETVKGFTRQVSAYEQDVTGYKNQVASFNQTVDGYKTEVAKQTQSVNGLTTEVANYKQAVNGYSAELSKNTQVTNGYKTEVARYKHTVDGYGNKLSQYTQSNNQLTAKVSSYEATVDGYTQSLTRVEGKVDNLQVGGQNLIKGTDDLSGIFGTGYNGSSIKYYKNYEIDKAEWGKTTNATRVVITQAGGVSGVFSTIDHFRMIFGKPYTVSFYVKNLGQNTIRFNLNGLMLNPDGTGSQSIYVQGGESGKFSAIGYMRDNPDWNWFQIAPMPSDGITLMVFAIAYLQVEEGTFATDWDLAPEEKIDTSTFKSYQNEVKSTTDEHTRRLTALDGDGGRLSKVEQTATQIQRSLSDYARTAYVDTKITEKAGEITTNLTRIEGKFDNLQFGGRNYIKDSYEERGDNHGHGITNLVITNPSELENSPVIVSFEAKHNEGNRPIPLHVYYRHKDGSNLGYSYGKGQTTTTEYKRFEIPIDSNKIPSNMDGWINLAIRNGVPSDRWSIRKIKLEKGNKATDWTMAEEDKVTKTEFQTVKESTNLFERTIGTTETNVKSNIAKITMSDSLFQKEVGNLIDRPNLLLNSFYNPMIDTNKYNSAKITLTTKPIVGRTYTIRICGEQNTKKTGFGVYNSGGAVRLATINKGTQIKRAPTYNGEKFVYETTFKWTNTNGTVTVDDSAIWLYSFPGDITDWTNIYWVTLVEGSTGKDWSASNSDLSEVSSKVTQLSNSWALTLKSGNDIKTAINATTDGIRLKGNLITLDGQVNMTSSFIVPEGNIGNLSAKKITSGTIDTARLNSLDIVTKGLTSNVVKSEHILANEALFTKLFTNDLATQKLATKQAWIKSGMIGDAQIGTAQIGQIDASNGKIVNFDARYITANHAELITAGFNGLNSRTTVDGTGINVTNTDGEFISLNNNAELRSRSSDGNYIVLGNGRLQVYNPTQNQGYFGVALSDADGSKKMGVY
ncbi:glucosaminidase domain-containing protein, partial [Globicatella sanguinis]